MIKYVAIIILLFAVHPFYAQPAPTKIKDWHYLDYTKNGHRGISLNEAYTLLKNKKSQPVIVAIIDSGIDTLQPDLRPVLWENPAEIPGNKIDDDGNGLVDDVYGWNYLGAPGGENLSISVSDDYRTYHRFKRAFEGKNKNEIPDNLQWQYREWKRAKEKLDTAYNKAIKVISIVRQNWQVISETNELLQKMLNKKVFTRKDLDSITVTNDKESLITLWKTNVFNGSDITNEAYIKGFSDYKNELEEDLVKKTTPPKDFRDSLLQDNGYNITNIKYGNNNLTGFSGYHGTSVSSIIGAVRNNGMGIDGIADNVQLMMIRAILGKDEFDKDIAVAIRYAVDHGAKVINMSFGKYISPDKRWVDEAIAYALSKDVVLVHAAGNDGADIDKDDNFPSPFTIENEYLPNLINVGASGDVGNLAASFSNYGKKMVDLFAPGVDIRCAIAGSGEQVASGTSLASPIVAGIAALLRSYFPALKATEIVAIIKKSGVSINEMVNRPGTNGEKISFSQLCNTGKIVNAAGAVKMAMEYTKGHKVKN